MRVKTAIITFLSALPALSRVATRWPHWRLSATPHNLPPLLPSQAVSHLSVHVQGSCFFILCPHLLQDDSLTPLSLPHSQGGLCSVCELLEGGASPGIRHSPSIEQVLGVFE